MNRSLLPNLCKKTCILSRNIQTENTVTAPIKISSKAIFNTGSDRFKTR